MGFRTEDEGPCTIRLQGVPSEGWERETGKKIKEVRVANGGEYQGHFEEYCQSKGIRIKYIVSKMLEKNELAERMSQTVMEKVQSMLEHAKLSKTFYVEMR